MTRLVNIKGVTVGGGSPVRIQSMNNTKTADVKATLDQIYKLKDCGCEITRVAVPDAEAAEALKEITKNSPLPVVADIHFDYRLAVQSAMNGAAKIRICFLRFSGTVDRTSHNGDLKVIRKPRDLRLHLISNLNQRHISPAACGT